MFALKDQHCDDCGEQLVADPHHPKMDDEDSDEVLGIVVCPECMVGGTERPGGGPKPNFGYAEPEDPLLGRRKVSSSIPKGNHVISPAAVCTWCDNEDLEDAHDPELLDIDAIQCLFYCPECGGTMVGTYALTDWEGREPGEEEMG